MNASHRAIGQNLQVVANPNAAIEQLMSCCLSDWRTGICHAIGYLELFRKSRRKIMKKGKLFGKLTFLKAELVFFNYIVSFVYLLLINATFSIYEILRYISIQNILKCQ